MISMDKTYRTRDGREVRLLCVDREGFFPVVGLVGNDLVSWTGVGIHVSHTQTVYDLIEVVPDVVRWVNVYSNGAASNGHPMRLDADLCSDHNRIAILKITTKNNGVNGAEDVSVEVLPVGGP